MAWDRIVELSIGTNGQGLLISDLHIDFKIERSVTLSENFAEFTIYNAKEETRNKILKIGNNLIFKAGYKDEGISALFAGNIIESISLKEGSNIITKIKSVSKSTKKELQYQTVSLSYGPKTSLIIPLQQIAGLAGAVVNGINNANILLVNGWVYVGSLNGAIRYIRNILNSYDIDMYIDNNELVVYQKGVASKFEVVILSYTGGLISVNNITEQEVSNRSKKASSTRKKAINNKKRIGFEALIIPQLQINAPVTINTDKIKGTFLTEKLIFEGNNYGGDFKVIGEAKE